MKPNYIYKTPKKYRDYFKAYYHKHSKKSLQEKIKALYGRYFSDQELKQFIENRKRIYTPKIKGNTL